MEGGGICHVKINKSKGTEEGRREGREEVEEAMSYYDYDPHLVGFQHMKLNGQRWFLNQGQQHEEDGDDEVCDVEGGVVVNVVG